MKMNRAFIALIICITSSVCFADDKCDEFRIIDGLQFELTIGHSKSKSSETFTFCKNDKDISLKYINKNKASLIYLKNEQIEYIRNLVYKAARFNIEKTILGKDGSTWCLNAKNGMNRIQGCFWSPDYTTSERDFEDLVNLKQYLAMLTKGA